MVAYVGRPLRQNAQEEYEAAFRAAATAPRHKPNEPRREVKEEEVVKTVRPSRPPRQYAPVEVTSPPEHAERLRAWLERVMRNESAEIEKRAAAAEQLGYRVKRKLAQKKIIFRHPETEDRLLIHLG